MLDLINPDGTSTGKVVLEPGAADQVVVIANPSLPP